MHRTLPFALALVPLLLSGCGREPTTASSPPPVLSRPAGLVEITISGIGTPQQRASARNIAAPATAIALGAVPARRPWSAPAATRAARLTTIAEGDGTVELEPVSTASFTFGTRTGGGYRYVSATYQVRNATTAGVAYTTARANLIFLAVNATGSLSGTAITRLDRFDGTPITDGFETRIEPTGLAALSRKLTITAAAPDILQVYTEAEVAAAPLPQGVTSIQPYGFVVSNLNTSSSRTLAASPAAGQFDGVLTVGYRVPLQATPADDPFTITGVFLPVDDAETWVTQSFEDTDVASVGALRARATALGAQVRSVAGWTVGTVPVPLECRVRSGGTAGAPTSFLVDSFVIASESPDPFAAPGSLIDSTASLAATFAQPMSGPAATGFVVNSFQGGRAFLGESYGGAGTATLSTPGGHFWPGDVVEVALTKGLQGASQGARVCTPLVYRYRVKAKAGGVGFTPAVGGPVSVGSGPVSMALGDVNGDGKLDVVTANNRDNNVTVLLGTGGGFAQAAGSPFSAGASPRSVALGDVNGDGKLDIVAANYTDNNVTVLLGTGSGSFAPAARSPFAVGLSPMSVALGDVNGDGKLDIVTANQNGYSASVLLGDGAGGFAEAAGSPVSAGNTPVSVALGDLNGDGKLDIVTANYLANTVTVLLGNGRGGFAPSAGSPFAVPGSNPWPNSVALGDVNGDGKLDLVTADGNNNTLTVLVGDGVGGFAPAPGSPMSTGTARASGVGVADVNGDGKLDIYACLSTNAVTVLLGDGAGGFTAAPGSPFAVGAGAYSGALGDVNGDGTLDIVVVDGGAANLVSVLLHG